MATRSRLLKTLILPGSAVAGLLLARALSRRSRWSLRNRVVLITGGSRGLGLLLAREFAGEGCRVAICARNAHELETARHSLKQLGADTLAISCDVSEQKQVEECVRQTIQHFGRIDVLVNNAGIITVGPVDVMTREDFENAMNVMFWGVLSSTLAVLPHMLERQGGRIVNITSIGGRVSVPHLIPYCCAKFAAVALSEGLRAELQGRGVQVTTVLPGLMRTGGHVNALFKGKQEAEFAWFSLGASAPILSLDAQRAARRIVRATKAGDAEVIVGTPAKLLALFKATCPEAVSHILGFVNRYVLPAADAGVQRDKRAGRALPGRELQKRTNSALLDFATQMGRAAAARFQTPG